MQNLCVFETAKFVARAIGVHSINYDFTRVIYKGNKYPVKVICKHHGIFDILPEFLLKGYGCPGCSHEKHMDKRDFISRAIEKHGAKYNYNSIKSIRIDKNVKIVCPKHGPFYMAPLRHLLGYGCERCL